MATLLIREPTQRKQLFDTTDETQVTIGRSVANLLALNHTSVSRIHAALYRVRGSWTIEDLKSRNGTFVNGRRVQRHALRSTDTVRIGDYELVYFGERDTNPAGFRGIRPWHAPAATEDDEETRTSMILDPESTNISDRMSAIIRPLEIRAQAWRPRKTRTVFGGKGGVVIERLFAFGPAAELTWNRRSHLLRRLSSYANITVNGKRMDSTAELQPGDEFQIGRTAFMYELHSPTEPGKSVSSPGSKAPLPS